MYYIKLPELSVGHIAGLPGVVSFIQLIMQHTDSISYMPAYLNMQYCWKNCWMDQCFDYTLLPLEMSTEQNLNSALKQSFLVQSY